MQLRRNSDQGRSHRRFPQVRRPRTLRGQGASGAQGRTRLALAALRISVHRDYIRLGAARQIAASPRMKLSGRSASRFSFRFSSCPLRWGRPEDIPRRISLHWVYRLFSRRLLPADIRGLPNLGFCRMASSKARDRCVGISLVHVERAHFNVFFRGHLNTRAICLLRGPCRACGLSVFAARPIPARPLEKPSTPIARAFRSSDFPFPGMRLLS